MKLLLICLLFVACSEEPVVGPPTDSAVYETTTEKYLGLEKSASEPPAIYYFDIYAPGKHIKVVATDSESCPLCDGWLDLWVPKFDNRMHLLTRTSIRSTGQMEVKLEEK